MSDSVVCVICGGPLGELFRCRTCGSASRVRDELVERVISQHPHSRVYVGRAGDGSRVAIKELLFSLVPRIEQLDAFHREAGFLKALNLKGTPRFVDAFSVGEGVETRLYLLQEFIEGESLLTRLQRGPIVGQAFDALARQVLETLAALHTRQPKILHRDIKPANLVFRQNGDLVLVDFGAARHLEQAATHGSTMVGTFGYMSPEQLGGTVDDSTDLYSLGATLLHAATGRPPSEFLVEGMHLRFNDVAGLSTQQNAFLRKLTAQKKTDRFVSATESLSWLSQPWIPQRTTLPAVPIALGLLILMGAGAFALYPRQVARAPEPPVMLSAPPAVPEAIPPVDAPPPPRGLPPISEALQKEQKNTLMAFYQQEKSYFQEHDAYTADLASIFSPSNWCPDGARLKLKERRLPAEVGGCHFYYGVQLKGKPPLQQTGFVYARGAIGPLLQRAWVAKLEGPTSGIVQEWDAETLFRALQVEHTFAAADLAAPAPDDPKVAPDSVEAELTKERLTGLAGVYSAEGTYFAEHDFYSGDFSAIRFVPDAWCPDGARLRATEHARAGEVTGCHYFYGVTVDGTIHENQSFRVYARGAIAPVAGKAWLLSSAGENAGIPEEMTAANVLKLIAK